MKTGLSVLSIVTKGNHSLMQWVKSGEESLLLKRPSFKKLKQIFERMLGVDQGGLTVHSSQFIAV